VNILTTEHKVARLVSNFQLYRRRFEADDVSMELELIILLETTKKKCSFADDIIRQCFRRIKQVQNIVTRILEL
jgi:hypothetical protein